MSFASLPTRLKAYVALTVLLGVAGLVATIIAPSGDAAGNPNLLAALLLCSAVFSTWKVELKIREGQMTLTAAIVCLAMILQGPLAAVLCAGLGAVVGTAVRQEPGRSMPYFRWVDWHRPLFNASNCMLASALAARLHLFAAEAGLRQFHQELPAQALAAVVFQTVYFIVNTAGISIALALLNSQSVIGVWQRNFLWTGLGYYASASAAVLIYAAYERPYIGALALLLVPPLYFIYYFYRVYLDRMSLLDARVEQDRRHIEELKTLNTSIMASLARAIDAKDRYTRSHISRVQAYAVALAEEAGLAGPELEAVRTASLVHDIGKIGIPERILGKPGKLSPEEFRRMQSHVTIGAEILAPVPFPWPVIPIVLSHHERWDGLGYPHGLRGEDIPIGGRIMAISDVFDALTSNRPYRPAMSEEDALAILRESAGRQFDPKLVELFTRILPTVRARVRNLEMLDSSSRTREPGEGGVTDSDWALSQIGLSAAEMSAACDLAQGLAETSSVADVIAIVIDRAQRLLPADTVIVYLCEEESGDLLAQAIGGMYADKLAGLRIARGEGVSGWVAETLQPQVKAQASLDIARRFNPNEPMELSAAAAVPLVQGGATIGVLTLYTSAYSVINEHHLGVLNILAEHAAAALFSALRYEQTRELSLTDPLTGLPNSRSLIHHVETLCGTWGGIQEENVGDRFAVLMFDLDGFKAVNDTLGHLRGDEVLQEFGEVLRSVSRDNDLPCRYAGDEFVVVLNEASEEQAQMFTRRVREVLDLRSRTWVQTPLGVSVGIACFPSDGRDVRSLLGVADKRMYHDKFSRRAAAADENSQADDLTAPGRRRSRSPASGGS